MAGALDGLRVVDLTRVVAGPLCAHVLGDPGADAAKVARRGDGDGLRAPGPPFVKAARTAPVSSRSTATSAPSRSTSPGPRARPSGSARSRAPAADMFTGFAGMEAAEIAAARAAGSA